MTLGIKKVGTFAFAAILASALTISLTPAYAQKHGGSGGSGSGHSSGEVDHDDSGHSGSKGGKGGSNMGHGGSGAQSLGDVFRDIESGAKSDQSSVSTDAHGKKGGSATTSRGKKGTSTAGKKTGKTQPKAAAEEDSDRPAWAGTKGGKAGGNASSGTKKGDIYGDMYVILRNPDGSPQLLEITLADGTKIQVVQPIGTDGQPLALDAEGNLVDATLAIPVDLGRLSVSRASSSVLTSQLKTAVDSLNAADSITLDAAGRLVLTKDGVSSAIDSPLENLALYKEVLTTGTITGLTADTLSKLTASTSPTLVALATTGVQTGDISAAASFLGAASDKTIPLTVDAVVNINTILGINTKTADGTTTYYSYSSFNFDPLSVYGSMTVDVLVKQTETLPDGTTRIVYVPTLSNVYTTLLSGQTASENIAAFTQAADDSRTIIQYVHDNSIATE